jgi:anthranilate synthase
MPDYSYTTPHGIEVSRHASEVNFRRGLWRLLRDLDEYRGIYLSSGYDAPGRYSRWDIASVRPPIEIVSRGRDVEIHPLNERGKRLAQMLRPVFEGHPHWEEFGVAGDGLAGRLKPMATFFSEEERSRQPSVFSVLRALIEEFQGGNDKHLSLIGAFGYDLLFQFDPIELSLPRGDQEDLRLFLCDDIYFLDRQNERIDRYQYDFRQGELSTQGVTAEGERIPPPPALPPSEVSSDHLPEEYMANVEAVRGGMRQGDFYEVVLRRTFSTSYNGLASDLFERVQDSNPSPYEFLLQFGKEQLVGASPEMFVRVEGRRVETTPISGTAQRTGDPLRDAENICELLGSIKEESELTMCTDVDRNDKSRICEPGTVRVLARRLVERFAGVFHTVDHVEGYLKQGCDSLDAFLSHMWSVTMIGAPKKAASRAVEALEKDARGWYGGAVGMISLNGDLNTGITIRTTRLCGGMAYYSAGATLLYDSDPAMEERETRLKATGFFRILGRPDPVPAPVEVLHEKVGRGAKLLLVDNDDCFIHTIANYARQTGAEVVTYRSGISVELIREIAPHLILISPGPGRPADFGVPDLVRTAVKLGIPVFGVCLGLQGIVEAFGGELAVLDYPMHGKRSMVRHRGLGIFAGLPEEFQVGRYHSLYARRDKFPACLEATAESTEGGVIMGVRHRELPVEAVQFHPESILTLTPGANYGLKLIENAIRLGRRRRTV